MAETDLAILTAFCRPYFQGDRGFAVPAPNNEILRELAQDGTFLDLDTLRGHLRNLYAKFGVEDGLNPAQKRARLAQLVHESRVIQGWEPQPHQSPKPAATRPTVPATHSPVPPVSPSSASVLPQPPRPSRWHESIRDRRWMAAAIAVPLLIAVAVSADLEGSQHTPPRVGSPALPAIGTDARAVATKSACQPDRFCLARLANMSGGLYQSASDDANLTDDTFYYFTDPTSNERLPRVGSHTWSAWNRGRRDVIVYDRPASTGAAACVRAGRKINLPVDWRDRIASFRFATHNLCARYDEPADATG